MKGLCFNAIPIVCIRRSTFYNRNTVSIVEQLVDGGFMEEAGALSGNKHARILHQRPVPNQYVDRAYIDLFMGLLQTEGVLALGLYRAQGTLGSPVPYVFTCPPKDCVVNALDLVYVLD